MEKVSTGYCDTVSLQSFNEWSHLSVVVNIFTTSDKSSLQEDYEDETDSVSIVTPPSIAEQLGKDKECFCVFISVSS